MEAILELRFAPSQEGIGDLLPGLLYGKLKHLFERVESLPMGSIPRDLRLANPDLRYRAHVRLAGKDQALLIGDHAVLVSKTPPYPGWGAFSGLCQEVLDALHKTELLGALERFSFKCLNILELAGRRPFDVLNGTFGLANYQLTDRGFRFRTEIDHGGFVNIVELGATATLEVGGVSRTGLMLSVDTLRPVTSAEFWPVVPEKLDSAHTVLKEIFFRLLTPAIVEELGPVWDNP